MALAILEENYKNDKSFTVSLKFDFKNPEINLLSADDVPSLPDMPFIQIYSSCLGTESSRSSTLKDFDRAARQVSAGWTFAS